MKEAGFVKLHRSMLEWGWYTDVPTRVLFDHLLLVVNWKPGVFLGQKIEPGSVVTSRGKLAKGSGLTEKQVRRALMNLESTGEIIIGRAGKGQLVTLTGWAFYQSDDERGAGTGPDEGRMRAGTGPDEGHYQRREERKKGRMEEEIQERVPALPCHPVPEPELNWPSFVDDRVRSKWAEFVAYRHREKKARYKSRDTEQKALDLCCKYFPSGKMFCEALDHAMARTWVFPVDPSEHKYPFSDEAKAAVVRPVWNARA